MKIEKQKLDFILNALADVYPYYIDPQQFQEMSNAIGSESEFDGHLLYLLEKGLIFSDMKWNPNSRAYQLSAGNTRISSSGLDYLEEQ